MPYRRDILPIRRHDGVERRRRRRQTPGAPSMLHNVAAVALNEFGPFELGVVCEVFGTDRSDEGLPTYDFAVVAGEPGPLRAETGFTMHTPHGLERLAEADLITIPAAGVRGPRACE